MNDFFSIVGSIASIGSIPLAIYLYFKSAEAKFEKVRKEISKVLSCQIGEDRELTPFEVQAVINSKLRENKLRADSIIVSEIVEDLISETIASPLLDGKRKEMILDNLKRIYGKGELIEAVEKLDIKQNNNTDDAQINFEEQVKALFEKRKKLEDELRVAKIKQIHLQERFSSYFGFIAIIMATIITISAIIISLVTEPKLIFSPIKDIFLSGGNRIIKILAGIIASLLTSILAYLFRIKTIKKREKDITNH